MTFIYLNSDVSYVLIMTWRIFVRIAWKRNLAITIKIITIHKSKLSRTCSFRFRRIVRQSGYSVRPDSQSRGKVSINQCFVYVTGPGWVWKYVYIICIYIYIYSNLTFFFFCDNKLNRSMLIIYNTPIKKNLPNLFWSIEKLGAELLSVVQWKKILGK